jgi:hypothetical protein
VRRADSNEASDDRVPLSDSRRASHDGTASRAKVQTLSKDVMNLVLVLMVASVLVSSIALFIAAWKN